MPGIHRGVAATFVVALATAAAIGMALDSWRLSCSGMAVAFSIWIPLLCYWEPDRPRNRVVCVYLSMIPGLGYLYVGDRKRAMPLLILMALTVVGFLMIFTTGTDSELEYVVFSCTLLYILSMSTSVVGASRGAKEAGIESTDPAQELDLRDEGRVIRIFTYVLTALFAWLCFSYYPGDADYLVYFMSVWALHVCLNLALYAKRFTAGTTIPL